MLCQYYSRLHTKYCVLLAVTDYHQHVQKRQHNTCELRELCVSMLQIKRYRVQTRAYATRYMTKRMSGIKDQSRRSALFFSRVQVWKNVAVNENDNTASVA